MMFLTVLGTILKIIGIVLLSIFLLLLLFLLVLLFVPVRYRAKVVREGEKLLVQAQVSYIFHLIRLPVCFEDGKLRIRLSVFGLTLYSNDRGSGGKKKKALEKKDGEAAGEGAKESGGSMETGGEDRAGKTTGGTKGTGDGTKETEKCTEEGGEVTGKEERSKARGTKRSAEFAKGRMKQVSRLAQGGEVREATAKEAVDAAKEGEAVENNPQESMSDMEVLFGMLAPPEEEDTNNAPKRDGPPDMDEDVPKGPFKFLWKLWQWIKGVIRRGKQVLEKISNIIQTRKSKISAVRGKASDFKGKGRLIVDFFRDEENKNRIKYAWKSILQLLKHVFPYKIEGDIRFATGSPYSMGRVLCALGMLYPLYGKSLQLSADFTADHFELSGSVLVKGRVRFGKVLWIALKLWRKGKILHLLSAIKELGQKLKAPTS